MIGRAIESVRRRLRQRQTGRDLRDLLTGMVAHPPAGDDLRYALPLLLPYTLEQHLRQNGKITEFLEQAYSQTVGERYGRGLFQDETAFGPIFDDPLTEWNWSTRYYIAEQVHAVYHRNPDAKALDHIAHFSIGDGFQLLTFHPLVEECLTSFIEHPENRIREYERQASIDLLLDGELVVRWYTTDGGLPIIVPKKPWQLQGITTELGRYRRLESFTFVLEEDTGDAPIRRWEFRTEVVPADEITFVTINNHSYELRGRSELFTILPALKLRKEWLENRARINHFMSSILWSVRVGTVSPAQLAQVAARYSQPPPPGGVAVESDKVDIQPIVPRVNATDAKDDGRQMLLQIAKGLHLPEYFLSDGENANLASATRQQLPALVKFEAYQRTLLDELWTPMFRKVLEMEVNAGRLPMLVPKHNAAGDIIPGELIDTVSAFEVSYAPILDVDLLNLTNALALQVANEFTSVRDARSRLGRDPDRIEKELQEEQEAAMRDVRSGRRPDMSFELFPDIDDEDEGGDANRPPEDANDADAPATAS